jgi:hypothetical protein
MLHNHVLHVSLNCTVFVHHNARVAKSEIVLNIVLRVSTQIGRLQGAFQRYKNTLHYTF